MNSSFGSRSDLHNKTLIEKSKLDGSIMLDKKRNLKQSRDNVSKNLNFKASLLLTLSVCFLSADGKNEEQNRRVEA